MFRNLIVLLLLIPLSGCVVFYDDYNHSRSSDGAYGSVNVWLENVSIQCDYDWESDYSQWHIRIDAYSYYGPLDIEYVFFYVNSYDTYYMSYQGDGEWRRLLNTGLNHCHEYVEFEFVAWDYSGNEGYYVVTW